MTPTEAPPSGSDRQTRDGIWKPSLGAWCDSQGTHFRVWAPAVKKVEVVFESGPLQGTTLPLQPDASGYFSLQSPENLDQALYRYRLEGQATYSDPASRFQPQGVHGPSQIIDSRKFSWFELDTPAPNLQDLTLYELHVGAFALHQNYAGVTKRLRYLADLGVTALELMPLAAFPGRHNWGYDGVNLFAPAAAYGSPEDLRQLVDTAHRMGLWVFLDVVYNHFGPDGNYLNAFSPYYFSKKHHTPWGDAINLDGEQSEAVRRFFIENALYWLKEFRFDGLRLDATHALVDDSEKHFLAELTETIERLTPDRKRLIIAEDHRNLAKMIQPRSGGGWGLDAVWSDDFHHELRRLLAGDHEGYYQDYSGTTSDVAETVNKGWFFHGQHAPFFGGPHGTESQGIPLQHFVQCIQNHDQIGNRAFGERLNHQIEPAAYRAASTLLLCSPETPLLFMGQEWAASTPFLYFTDHNAELGEKVTQGRREEFKHFSVFQDPQKRQQIPDPQNPETFNRSCLNWPELAHRRHAAVLRLYRALLRWRHNELGLRDTSHDRFQATAVSENGLRLEWQRSDRPSILILIQLRSGGEWSFHAPEGQRWEHVLNTEDPSYALDPAPIEVDYFPPQYKVQFLRPGAFIFRSVRL